jgi:hypothetical protein
VELGDGIFEHVGLGRQFASPARRLTVICVHLSGCSTE